MRTEPTEKRILHLTLHKKWFVMIASGEKKEEYRTPGRYWFVRLFTSYRGPPKKFDEIHFRNGYNPKNPFMRVQHVSTWYDNYNDRYVISLGKVLEVRNGT